ncbi:hypothetical protein QOL99_02290 [Deinococcus sp. MIMF12]|uniref:Uncharacterized protein n=1 Tax=Deinococcus rhizophilus TaxID=3049544 RepID=A0ABT7JD38_9DEIO|nr:hypothetical protein [Deinococcus rhizophilus]MDL2342973.1 hypothetical protein [Deinococcus rhizophilus]
MKKTILGLTALILTGTAAAQSTWTYSNNNWRATFQGCVRVSASSTEVRCSFTDTYVGPDSTRDGSWQPDRVIAVLNGGMQVKGSTITVAGKSSNGYQEQVAYKDLPINVIVNMTIPVNISTVARLNYFDHVLSNVSIRLQGQAATATPAPANTGNYNAVMTNCKAGANGTLTCTATLTPRR